MTIAISLKVHDGVILAADSASTVVANEPDGSSEVVNVYNTANKVFNLRKSLPIGAITWGAGSIGIASISTIVKDLRKRFSGEDPGHSDWHLDPENYTVEHVAARLREFVFEDLYQSAVGNWAKKPSLGFIVAGYSAGSSTAEEYSIQIDDGKCPPPAPLRRDGECGVAWHGEPEAISRLIFGFSPMLPHVMERRLGVPREQIGQAIMAIRDELSVPLVVPPMPIQDAIDLSEFLVHLTIQFSRFMPGAPTVGGPIELAAITRHEGFKWVHRKHYFNTNLNPEMKR